MPTEPTPIPELPTTPSRNMTRAAFVAAMNAWFAAWPVWRLAANLLASVTYSNAQEAVDAAAAAAASETAAGLAAAGALAETAYATSSNSSLLVGFGSKAFTVPAGLAFAASGDRVTAFSRGSPIVRMRGPATYVGTTLTITVDELTVAEGYGTYSDWGLILTGVEPDNPDIATARAAALALAL